MFVVYVKNKHGKGCYYRIEEVTRTWRGVTPGDLVWKWVPNAKMQRPVATVSILRVGSMHGTSVRDEEAELLTGLFMPAAMDRLRELVDAARVVFTE